ncbi:hypothetical protein M569_13110 [Genlisea aurea]|uniref:Uncharacterized protein n=1 Tax=Genlisea aurea TaxID=192259 RepID=S8C4R1_9LAMI|nr:hypothetical protein M569_13110 [Genlisea aurea]
MELELESLEPTSKMGSSRKWERRGKESSSLVRQRSQHELNLFRDRLAEAEKSYFANISAATTTTTTVTV